MPPNHLVGYAVNDFGQGEGLLLFIKVVEKNYLEKQISHFFLDHPAVIYINGLQKFVKFFDQIGPEAFNRLFSVPGATVRLSQTADDLHQLGKLFSCFFRSIHPYKALGV